MTENNEVPKEVRKRLTEWIGEEFPVLDCKLSQQERCQPYADLSCFPCNYLKYTQLEFDTWADLGALKEKLVAEGLWAKCYWFMRVRYIEEKKCALCSEHDYTDWLFNPIRFALLVDEFLEGRK